MSEVLSNTGAKLWSETDYNELWLTVFDQLTGQGGKSNIRLIDEAIGKINDALDGYKFEFSSVEGRLYISKGDSKLPVSLIDSNGHVASKVDGTTITIDENGIVKGIPVDDALSEESTNPLQNKVIASELKNIKSQMSTDESTIESNTKRIEANETAISTLNGTGDGSVKKAVSDGIAKVVAGAPEDFDTLKEMSDWINSHESSASSMNSQIQDNKKAIDNHVSNGDIHVTTENKTNWNKVSEKMDKTGDASNVTTVFTTATTRSNLTTKEKLSISLGKISKWFSDLKTVAFSGSYNDLSDKPTSLPASDVSSWAKASTKPTYTKAEVGLGNVDNTADANKSVKYAISAGSASSASKATGVVDYAETAETAKTIQIGYAGSGIAGDDIKYIAGYTTGNGSDVDAKIKNVSKDALKSWLGLGSLAYSSATIPTITIEEINPNVGNNEISAVGATINPSYITPHIKKTKIKSGSNIIVFSNYEFSIEEIKNDIVDIKFKSPSFVKYKGIGSVTAYNSSGIPLKITLSSISAGSDFCLYIDSNNNISQSASVGIEIFTVYLGVEK